MGYTAILSLVLSFLLLTSCTELTPRPPDESSDSSQPSTRSIAEDTTPPRITLHEPDDLRDAYTMTVTTNEIRLSGVVTDASGVAAILVNDTLISLDTQGHFRYTAHLDTGENALVLVASDDHGNQAGIKYTITVVTESSGEELSAKEYIREGLTYLQEGEEEKAREAFDAVLRREPDNKMATAFLQQLSVVSEDILAQGFFEYTVRPGDSLSAIAQRYLGDKLKFYILAKINKIDNPSQISAGLSIKIPGEQPEDIAPSPEPPQPDTPPAQVVAQQQVVDQKAQEQEQTQPSLAPPAPETGQQTRSDTPTQPAEPSPPVRREEDREVVEATTPAPMPPPPSPIPDINFGRYQVLVIGNNDYEHLPSLKTALTDAKAVADMLGKEYGFNVTLLRNATREEIIVTLDKLRGVLTKQDNLLIYYAGHGVLDPEAERGYWLPVDAHKNTRANWISTSEITDTLKAMTAKHVLVVADSCYSGTLVRNIPVGLPPPGVEREAYLKRMIKKRSRTALTSGGLEPVLDSGGGNHSVFAKAFLTVLRENQDILEAQQLFSHVRPLVVVNSPQTPEYANIRFAGHEGGDFLFVREQ